MNSTKYWKYNDAASRYELHPFEGLNDFGMTLPIQFIEESMFIWERDTIKTISGLIYRKITEYDSTITEEIKKEVIEDIAQELRKNGAQ